MGGRPNARGIKRSCDVDGFTAMTPLISVTEARRHYSDGDTAHSFEHVLRVVALAERIAREEGAELETVRAAALLHDVARAESDPQGLDHAEEGARRAREILQGCPPGQVEAIAQAIASHRFRNRVAPPSLEAQVLYDADKLDAIGAIGVARAYAVAGLHGQRLWSEPGAQTNIARAGDITDPEHTPVREFEVKLSRIRDTLYTRTGKRIAEERHKYMVEFFARLGAEVRGEA